MKAMLHTISNIHLNNGILFLNVDGRDINLPVSILSQRLSLASEADVSCFEISPSGYGIHWPKLDEDLSVKKILELAKLL